MDTANFMPFLRYGHRIQARYVEGLLGVPYSGKTIFVDPSNGSDSSNGSTLKRAVKTVAAAYALATSAKHEAILIVPTGGTGRTTETTAITWAKRFTHLIGNAAPTAQDARAGINFDTGASLVLSENGCLFKNVTLTGTADINEPVSITGDYNAFVGVDFKGSLNATTGDDAAARCLNLDGGQENTFLGCTLGQDTVMRGGAANTTLELENAASRNVFEGCRFIAAIDGATVTHVLFTGTSAIDRWVEFKDCSFYSFSANNATAMTACMDLSAQTATGHVLATGVTSLMGGITDWEATASGRIYMQRFTETANVLGLPLNPTVS